MIFLISIIGLLITNISCQKNRRCVCVNPGGKFIALQKKGSKVEIEELCSSYYQNNYSHIPWNETFCEVK